MYLNSYLNGDFETCLSPYVFFTYMKIYYIQKLLIISLQNQEVLIKKNILIRGRIPISLLPVILYFYFLKFQSKEKFDPPKFYYFLAVINNKIFILKK